MNKIKTLTLYNISKNKKGVPISKHSQNHLIKEINYAYNISEKKYSSLLNIHFYIYQVL